MYIKSLSIIETYPTDKVIRTITFKVGPNLIVDASIGSDERGNGIGKTTTLKVLDICLGAKDRKYLYTDYEMNVENTKLKDYIHDSKLQARMVIVNDAESLKPDVEPENAINIAIDLYSRGNRYINGEKYNYEDFTAELNSTIFDSSLKKPTFRQLISMFVRVDQKSDNDGFLKYLHSSTSNLDYENVYNFLFRLSDVYTSETLYTLKEKCKSLKSDIDKLKSLNSISTINVIKQKILSIEREIKSLKTKLSTLVSIEELRKNEDKLRDVKSEYALLAEKIDEVGFKLSRYTEIVEDTENKLKNDIDMSVLKNLYEETNDNFSDLTKTFEDLVRFNKQLVDNKLEYFRTKKKEARQQVNQLLDERKKLLDRYKNVIVLIKDNDVESYVSLQTQLENQLQELGKNNKIIEIYTSLQDELEKHEEEIRKTTPQEGNPEKNIEKFNVYFEKFSKAFIKENYMLHLTESGFPIGISNVSSGLSTGTKKSVISAFDLAYQAFTIENNIPSPRFIVHDVIETMDGVALQNTIATSKTLQVQYIVAVLKDKIKDKDYILKNDIRLELSETNKLFRI